MNTIDIPSPIDLRLMSDALEWEKTAMARPFREEFFEVITNELLSLDKSALTILELGSGPGFLASHILSKLPDAKMVLLDFSPAMHELAKQRLVPFAERYLLTFRLLTTALAWSHISIMRSKHKFLEEPKANTNSTHRASLQKTPYLAIFKRTEEI